ncbi:ECs_2282 family putative zinc-binding protein [Paraburkholderia nodosa]|uniref:ECs_2282 family putative zinc-binding protein n=1 Tax=Paraburkholderia nodosa TaxID=392320 RepID=UPI0008413F29|nr:hypothetical protein [Paraburkholderia nodosa]
MSNDQISVSFKCKKCGTQLSWPDDAADSFEVSCAGCGASAGTYGELRSTAMKEAKQHIEKAFADAFKKLR